MATAVSHAMRRHPIRSSDAEYSHCGFRTASSSQPWTKVEESESSLSRSMRYAEPWLYGSVRAPSGLLFTPALILCSCADYLNGTKRSRKGQTICKKCKATRIPLNNVESPKFGTVRCYPTAPLQHTCARAGTSKVFTKSRTSILNPAGDPYNLVRQSRLSVSENNSQYRPRSVSPNKNHNRETRSSSSTWNKSNANSSSVKYSTVGRKSILECNVNPYELMTTDVGPQDASITFVNGQRIRVRPRIQDIEYEDVQITRQSSQKYKSGHQLVKLKNVRPASPKPNRNEKESECNRFKSILKKPTTTFNDTVIKNGPERSPSPVHKSGSHFYLPLPANSTPRKKVQFFVENEYVSRDIKKLNNYETNKHSTDTKIQKEDDEEEEAGKNAVIKTRENIISEDSSWEDKDPFSTANSCKLRRSRSERKSQQEAAKVLFHDTMALRVRTCRSDMRDTFFTSDLEKLDGIDLLKLKNFDKIRPKGPPPISPQALDKLSQNDTCIQSLKQTNTPKLAPLASPDCLIISQGINITEQQLNGKETNNIAKESNRPVPKKQITKDKKNSFVNETETVCEGSHNVLKTTSEIIKSSVNETNEKFLNVLQAVNPLQNSYYEGILNKNAKDISESEKNMTEIPKILSENIIESIDIKISEKIASQVNINGANYDKVSQFTEYSEPPSAPPRKKNSNKQTLTINTTNKNSISVISPIVINEVSNKTVVKISSPVNTVHKLKIRNEFHDVSATSVSISDDNLGKTSIMINDDDCYCTVNVKDDISIYQSSVVVKDTGVVTQAPEKKSSSIYITGNFISTSLENNLGGETNESEISLDVEYKDRYEQNDDYKNSSNDCNITKVNENNLPISNISVNDNAEQTGGKINNDDMADRPLELCSARMIKQLLCDPVEAVKRNLVPHVCGRSDVPRRPRDNKCLESGDLVANFLNGSLLKSTSDYLQTHHVSQLIEESLKLRNHDNSIYDDKDVSSEHSSSTQYETMDPGSDCYTDNSNRSSVTEEELSTRSKFYELLAESAVEVADNDDHHYESIKANVDPIYEEIEIPPPLPMNPPPAILLDDVQLDKEYTTRSIFEGASKYDILSYLVDAKERGIVPEDSYTFNFNNSGIVVEDDGKDNSESYNRISHMSTVSDSGEESSLVLTNALTEDKVQRSIEVERNDSGVGSETSKSSLSKYRLKQEQSLSCEDCDSTVDLPEENEPLICRKCLKKRSERKEIITEIVETEEKYSRDLQIVLEEFYQPMLVAGLLTSEQLSAIFLNVEELLENSQALAERLRDAVEIAIEQGDEDLLTVSIGKLILEAAPMLHAFETYCIRQGAASLLLAGLEKEKELLRIFLRVSQMENTVLRRMNLNSFLMVPVQRVTKYPLLLARLYKVTPIHHEAREQLKEARHKIELHLNHMNSETKDVPSKLWRRISSNNGRRSSSEMDLVNIKLRKIAVDVLEWNHDEAKFALEGKLLFTQPTDNNWRKGRTIKLTPVNALLVTNGKVLNSTTRPEPVDEGLIFSCHSGVREAALLLVRDKNGRYSLLREPLYLDRCVIAADPAWQSYFEVQELLGKDTFIFKADDEDQTKIWYRHLQYYAQGMGAWRKRRNALANIMINGMGLRS